MSTYQLVLGWLAIIAGAWLCVAVLAAPVLGALLRRRRREQTIAPRRDKQLLDKIDRGEPILAWPDRVDRVIDDTTQLMPVTRVDEVDDRLAEIQRQLWPERP